MIAPQGLVFLEDTDTGEITASNMSAASTHIAFAGSTAPRFTQTSDASRPAQAPKAPNLHTMMLADATGSPGTSFSALRIKH